MCMHYIVGCSAVAVVVVLTVWGVFSSFIFWFSFVCSSFAVLADARKDSFIRCSFHFLSDSKTTNSKSVHFFWFLPLILHSYRFSLVVSFSLSFSFQLIWFFFGSFDLNWFLLTICFYCIQNWSLCCWFIIFFSSFLMLFYSLFIALVFRIFLIHLRYTSSILHIQYFWLFVISYILCFCLFFDWAMEIESNITYTDYLFAVNS